MGFIWLKLGSSGWLHMKLVLNEGMELSAVRFASSGMLRYVDG